MLMKQSPTLLLVSWKKIMKNDVSNEGVDANNRLSAHYGERL